MRTIQPTFTRWILAIPLLLPCVACAESVVPPVDRATFETPAEEDRWTDVGDVLHEVGDRRDGIARRVYVSGLIGPSFATLSSPADSTVTSAGSIFTIGGALGMAFDRPHGAIRLELEGLGRDTYDNRFFTLPTVDAAARLTNNWSVMQNAWRDVMLTERIGVYGGGGIGAGGFILGERYLAEREYVPAAGNFAWQVGGGIFYDVTDRLALDIGYRYFQISTIQSGDSLPVDFTNNELMFTVRLYEPFRRWVN